MSDEADVVKGFSLDFRIVSKLLENRIILFYGELDTNLTAYINSSLLLLDNEDQSKEIKIYINSEGGNLDCLFSIYDTIQTISAPVSTICMGAAYSSAAVILSSGEKGRRFASANSFIMIHQAQITEFAGSGTEFERTAKSTKISNNVLHSILAKHTGQYLSKIKRDCEHDKYMTAEQAKDYGLIDNIIEYKKEIPSLKKKASGRKKEGA